MELSRKTHFSAGAALFGERLGDDDHDPAARGRSQSRQRGTVVDPPLGHGQHPRQQGHPGRHAGHIPSCRAVLPPATKHVVPAALRRGRLPQLQELHPGAGEHHACPLRPRWLLRRLGHEQGMAAPVFGRLGISRSRGPSARRTWRGRQDGVACEHTATTSSKLPSLTPPSSTLKASSSPGTSNRSPLPRTSWTGPWQRRHTARTTRPCQTRRLSRS